MSYADRLAAFVKTDCTGRQYDSCVSSPCVNASPDGCRHPNHPKHDTHDFRDRGDPMEKIYPITDWRAWERRTDMDVNF